MTRLIAALLVILPCAAACRDGTSTDDCPERSQASGTPAQTAEFSMVPSCQASESR